MTTDYSDAVDALYPAKDAEAPAVMQSPGNRGLPNDVSTATPFREPVEAEPNTTEPKPTLTASVGPTPKAAPRGEYDDAVDQVLARKDADTSANGFLSWKAANPGIDHEKAVDVLHYAEVSGFSPDYVAQHLDVVKSHVDASQEDVEQLAQKSPALRDALLEKPTLVPAVKDDLPKLSLLEELFTDPWRATAQIPFAVGDAVMQQAIVARQFAKAKGWGGLENDKAIEELKAEYPEGKDYGIHSVLGGYIIGGAKLAPYGVLDYLGGLTGGYAGAAGGGALGAAVGAVAGLAGAGAGAVPGAASGGAVGEAVGGVAGAMLGSGAVNYFETLGPLREEIGKLRDENGQAIPKEIADAYAEHYALLTGGLLGVGGPIGGSRLAAGVYKKVILKAVAEDATKTLLEPGAIALAKRFAGRYGMHELSAFLIGGAQAGLAESAQEGAMEESGQPFDMTDRSVSGVAFKGGVQMAKDMALLSGAHAGMETMADRDRADGLRVVLKYQAGQLATSKSAEQLHSIVDLVGSAEQFKKLPDGEKAALLERMAKQSGTPNVYVDREGWDRYWQGQKADPAAQAQRVVGDDGSAYANAHNAGGELVIPLEKFAAFAASDNAHAKALVDESRLYQEGASPRAARESQAKFQKRAADLSKMDPTQMPPDAKQVYDDYRARAEAAGRGEKEADANAKLVAAGFQSWAERFTDGGSPTKAWDLYRRQDVTITGGRGQGLAPGDINAQVEPETLKSMREAYAKSEPVAKRQEFFTDRTTGLYNFRGYEARKADAARPYTTTMELAGIKQVNDELGHATADASLKAMAEATRAAGVQDAVRRGTTISFDHATPEQGEAVAKAAQEAIGHGQVVTHGTTKAEGLMGPEDRLKAADEAHRTAKEAGREAGTVPQRGAPLNPEGKGLLPHLASIKRSELAPVLPEHEASYAEHLEKQDPFDTVHLTKGGSLTEDGFRLAEDLAVERAKATGEKVYYLSADARGIKAIHEAFASGLHEDVAGRPTDAVMEEMEHVLREAGGARFNVARPHGDEFYAVVVGENDKKRLEAMFKDAAAQAERRVFWRLDGEHVVVQNGVKLAFGTGETFDAADREALPEAKREQGDATAPERLGHEAFNDFARGLGPEHQLVRVGPAGRQGRQGRGVQAETGGVESGSGVGSERPVYVDPEITLHPTAKVPTERAMADAEAVAADMRSPIRKAVTEDFLDHVRSFLAGDQPTFSMADLPRDIENALSKFGIVDPENGYRSEEDLQHLGRGGEKKQVGNTEYDRSTREDKAAQLRKNLGKLGQPAPAEPNLLVQHNIREAGLKHADELGGLAAGAFTLDSKRGRGSISFDIGGTGKRRTFNIEILKGSDTSTLAHETFHFLSEVMADLAADPKAPAGIKANYAAMVKEMGYESPEARLAESEERRTLNKRALVWDRMTKEEKAANPDAKPTVEEKARLLHLTAKEERGSHGWEQYLLEGKTPSVALAGTFARFRNWLTGIYKSILGVQDTYKKNYGEELGLSDTMRRVFDRILASDKEVEKQQSAADAQPMTALFKDATPEQRAAYEKTYAEAKEAAKTEMLKRLAEADKTENNAYFTGERERIRGEVEKELPGNKVYEAVRQLQGGVDVGGTVYKLDRKSLTKAYGKEYVATIGHKDIFAGKEDKALSADALAPLLGFEKGDELVRAIQGAPPRDRYIAGEVQKRMEDLHGPALIDSDQAMAAEALDSIHNPKAVERALMERRRLAEKLSPEQARRVPRIYEDTLKSTAERMVAQRTVGELIAGDQGAAGYYLRAERIAARKAREAAEAGKWSEAIGENEKQLLNMFMWREATDLRERMNVLGRALKQSTKDPWRTELGKADVAAGGDHVYLGAHDAIFQAVGGEDPAPPVGPMLDALDALVKAVGQDGLGFDPTALRDLMAKPTPWSDLTTDQAENVIAAVKSIRHAASNQTGLDIEGKRIDRAAWYASAQEHSDYGKKVPKPAAESAGEKVVQKIGWAQRGFDAWLTSIDSYIETLDNGDLNGPWHQLFVHDRHVARATLVELDKRIVGGVRTAMEAMPKKMQARLTERVPELAKILPVSDRYVDEIEAPETRSALYALFLNSGNADNRQRLRDGNGWSDEQVNKALQLLHPEEAHFLQGVLDTVDSLHPDLAKVHERRTGMPLGKVVATPITIGGETFRGGYFPIRYDPKITRQGAVQMSDVEAGLFPQGMHSPTVYSGHTKARMEKVLAPVSLEFSTVQTHLAQVVQDIAMGDWVRKAASITLDDRFKKIVDKRLGPERTALFMPWLRDIANDRAGAVAAAAEGTPGFIRTASAITRNVYSSGVMALNLGSMLAHLTDPLAALGEAHGPAEMAARVPRIASAYLKTLAPGVRPEHELSKELDYRESKETANIRIELDRMRLPTTPGLREAVQVRRAVEHVSTLVRHRLDMFHSKLLWQIGFDEGIAKGLSMEDAAKAGDSLLTKTLPSGDIAERPALLRSKHSFAAVVLFHGYANKMFNLWVHAPMARARDAFADRGWNSVPGSAADLAAKWIVMGAVGALGAKLAGRGPKEDDDAGEWAITRMLMEPFASTPLGPFLEGGVQVATGEKFQASPRTVPEAQVVSDFAVGFGRSVHKAMEGEGGDDLVWQTVQTLAGVGLGPAGQIRKTAGYIHGLATGDAQPESPVDVAKGMAYGPVR